MKTLIMSSSFTTYDQDENGNRTPRIIDNENGFLDSLKKHLTKRDCMVIISGRPKKERGDDPNKITREGFAMSGIAFKEYIYVDDTNKHNIKEYVKKADCINLFGGHLPTANAFINELNLKELIQNFNGVVMGASGGAMNMAGQVYCIPEVEGEHKDKNFNRFLYGLGLTDIKIIPHYQIFKQKVFSDGTNMLTDILLEDSKKTKLVCLPDRSYLVVKNNTVQIFGKAYILENGQEKELIVKNIIN